MVGLSALPGYVQMAAMLYQRCVVLLGLQISQGVLTLCTDGSHVVSTMRCVTWVADISGCSYDMIADGYLQSYRKNTRRCQTWRKV